MRHLQIGDDDAVIVFDKRLQGLQANPPTCEPLAVSTTTGCCRAAGRARPVSEILYRPSVVSQRQAWPGKCKIKPTSAREREDVLRFLYTPVIISRQPPAHK